MERKQQEAGPGVGPARQYRGHDRFVPTVERHAGRIRRPALWGRSLLRYTVRRRLNCWQGLMTDQSFLEAERDRIFTGEDRDLYLRVGYFFSWLNHASGTKSFQRYRSHGIIRTRIRGLVAQFQFRYVGGHRAPSKGTTTWYYESPFAIALTRPTFLPQVVDLDHEPAVIKRDAAPRIWQTRTQARAALPIRTDNPYCTAM